MSIIDGFLKLAADGLGKAIDASKLTVATVDVFRQRINVSSPSDPTAHAEVRTGNTPARIADSALVVAQRPDAKAALNSIPTVTLTGTATALPELGRGPNGILVQAGQGNVGATRVATNAAVSCGRRLLAGESSVFDIDDASNLLVLFESGGSGTVEVGQA